MLITREYSTNAAADVRPASDVLGGYRSDRGARALLGCTNSLPPCPADDQRGLNTIFGNMAFGNK